MPQSGHGVTEDSLGPDAEGYCANVGQAARQTGFRSPVRAAAEKTVATRRRKTLMRKDSHEPQTHSDYTRPGVEPWWEKTR